MKYKNNDRVTAKPPDIGDKVWHAYCPRGSCKLHISNPPVGVPRGEAEQSRVLLNARSAPAVPPPAHFCFLKGSNSHFANVGRASGPPVGGASRSVEGPEARRTGRPEACPTLDAQNENCCLKGVCSRRPATRSLTSRA